MAWLKLCNEDPLVATLSGVFHANIIRVPEQRMQPLRVLARKDEKLVYRGQLGELLLGAPGELQNPPMANSGMADISGKRSRKVDAKLGLDILKGFLSGFGLPAALNIEAQFSGASEVSFSFSDVQRVYIEPSRLGQLLRGRQLDLSNPVASAFVGKNAWECLVLDSVITSKDFTISIDRQASADFQLDVPAIEDMLAKAKADVKVSSASTASLTFKGAEARAFAFTCQALIVDEHGAILQLPPDAGRYTYERAGASPHVQISEQPVMLELSEEA